uniref:1-acylglycerol-3-phosphate O-acyltransferase ABHD5 n=1 Tax=Rhipicephalus appendiculatus TaxID=34631 RepID=A0A131YYF9_RHIAP
MSLEDQSSAELSKGLRLLKHTCLLADTLLSSLIDLVPSWISSYIRWCPTSSEHLEEAERKLLSYVKLPIRSTYVSIDSILGCKGSHQIRTLQLGPGTKAAVEEERVPLVLVHGFGAGVALWLLNLDYLAQDRTTYCFDLLGFGRSSRPRLSRDSLEAEYQFVQSIEEWRAQVGLDRFVLLGHSMGGFLAASYAIRFPERVAHLVLADPWGFPERNTPRPALQLPSWVRVVSTLLSPFNPLAAVRIAGPWGPRLVEKIRPDIGKKYGHVVDDKQAVPHYIYHCNAQTPSGESAFKAMMTQYGWARHPMISRIGELHQSVPMTFIYGSRSWVDKQPGIRVQRLRPESEVDVEIIDGAGHHIFADKPEQFNEIVSKICRGADAAEKTNRALAEEKEKEEWEQREMVHRLAL